MGYLYSTEVGGHEASKGAPARCLPAQVLTTPAREWELLTDGTWRPVAAQPYDGPKGTAPGAFTRCQEGARWVEDVHKRRQRIDFCERSLHADLATRINASRRAWEEQHPTAGGVVLVSEEDVRGTKITRLELRVVLLPFSSPGP